MQITYETTQQQVFDHVVSFLFKQGVRSVTPRTEIEVYGVTRVRGGSCVYRGPKGMRCAAGVLIRDEDYVPEMEVNSIGSIIKNFPVLNYLHPFLPLIKSLQVAHDGSDVTYWPARFANVAREHALDPRVIYDNVRPVRTKA